MISLSTMVRQVSCAPKSVRGRNIMPTASRAAPGVWPERSIASSKKAVGSSTWMPAPSPVLPSASTAPRCHTAFNASIAADTTRRDALPSVAAISPTPQASLSNSGRYMPSRARRSCSAVGSIGHSGAIAAGHRKVRFRHYHRPSSTFVLEAPGCLRARHQRLHRLDEIGAQSLHARRHPLADRILEIAHRLGHDRRNRRRRASGQPATGRNRSIALSSSSENLVA